MSAHTTASRVLDVQLCTCGCNRGIDDAIRADFMIPNTG
jgi:hypothetical protein